jgi:cytochrome c oxidase subunit 1
MTGKMYNEMLGKIAAGLVFVGFNVTFFTQFILGSQGMPRRYHDYIPQYETLHAVSTVGSWILAAGLFLVMFYLLASLFSKKKAPANPWGAATLEWTNTASPPDPHNFTRMPVVTHGPYDYHLLPELYTPGHGGNGTAGDGAPATAEPAGGKSTVDS